MKKKLLLICYVLLANSSIVLSSFRPIGNKILWGMTTWGGQFNKGVIFRYDLTTGRDSILFNFDGIHGERPTGKLIQGYNGNLYGTSLGGGTYSQGVIFGYNIATHKYTVLYNFNKNTGGEPDGDGSLIRGKDSNLYGLASTGGRYNNGVLFRFNLKSNHYSILFSFDSTNGEQPSSLIQGSDGNLYGMASNGGSFSFIGDPGDGTLFKYNLKKSLFSLLYKFNGTDGSEPTNGLMEAKNGLLYGMTHMGGNYDDGVIFSYNLITNKFKLLLDFNDTNGSAPFNNLLQASNGNFYGVAFGGNNDNGIIFRFNSTTFTNDVLVNFDALVMPYSGLIEDNNGILYGMNNRGGKYDEGYIYSYNTTTDKYKILLSFNGNNGTYPNGSLLFTQM